MYNINDILSKENLINKTTNKDEWNNLLNQKKILCKNYIDNESSIDENYYIIKYNKSLLKKEEYLSYGLLRSVIFYKDKILAFSPPKAIDFKEFINKYPLNECYAEDFIEGTMINVFYMENTNEWKISTKSAIDAQVYFYDNKLSFNNMFFEACKYCNLDLNNLPKEFSYTFILQHPNNRIVAPIIRPHLYLIKVYKIDNNTIYNINLEKFCFDNNNLFINPNGFPISIPNIYPITSYEELISYFASMNTPYYYPGIMIYHTSGIRTKVRNPVYEDIKFLRGNQPKLFFQYLNLRKNGKVRDYLNYYPEHKKILNEFRNIIHRYTTSLWQNYIYCFINKEKHLKEYPFHFKIHMYNLHQKYINNKEPITKNIVVEYINSLDPAQVMYALNYDSS